MRPRLLLAMAVVVAGGPAAGAPRPEPQRSADHAPPQRSRSVSIDAVRGDAGAQPARSALHEAIGRHLARRGFTVVEHGKNASYRLQPALLLLDTQGGSNVELKASVVALDRKGHVVAMVEGGARTRGAAARTPVATLQAQAVEAAARSLAEDLARRLLEAR